VAQDGRHFPSKKFKDNWGSIFGKKKKSKKKDKLKDQWLNV
tara:strand:- start:462 stop:584 length:123 start_codon:yes stop_codon:yes gene_type:complete